MGHGMSSHLVYAIIILSRAGSYRVVHKKALGFFYHVLQYHNHTIIQ